VVPEKWLRPVQNGDSVMPSANLILFWVRNHLLGLNCDPWVRLKKITVQQICMRSHCSLILQLHVLLKRAHEAAVEIDQTPAMMNKRLIHPFACPFSPQVYLLLIDIQLEGDQKPYL
jgi:hypothetical protein